MFKEQNFTMLADFYEFTMANGYFHTDKKDKTVYFDVFYRDNPDDGGYAIVAGLEQIVEYIRALHFTEEDLDFLRSKNLFCESSLSITAI